MWTIIVGVDGSPASHAALRWAASVASAQDCEIAAVAVQPRTPAFMPAASMALLPYGKAPEPQPAARAQRLHALVEQAGAGHVTEHLLTGDPARELTRLARPGDLLVIGRGSLIGSVARACVRHAQCPVVVVPAE